MRLFLHSLDNKTAVTELLSPVRYSCGGQFLCILIVPCFNGVFKTRPFRFRVTLTSFVLSRVSALDLGSSFLPSLEPERQQQPMSICASDLRRFIGEEHISQHHAYKDFSTTPPPLLMILRMVEGKSCLLSDGAVGAPFVTETQHYAPLPGWSLDDHQCSDPLLCGAEWIPGLCPS